MTGLVARPRAIAEEEYTSAVLTRDRYRQDEIGKKAYLQAARLELEKAQTVLDMHTIRSPVAGVVRSILKYRGEGVRSLDPLFVIEPRGKD